jgi:hypothetical protein
MATCARNSTSDEAGEPFEVQQRRRKRRRTGVRRTSNLLGKGPALRMASLTQNVLLAAVGDSVERPGSFAQGKPGYSGTSTTLTPPIRMAATSAVAQVLRDPSRRRRLVSFIEDHDSDGIDW